MEKHINKFVAVWALVLTAFLFMGLTVPNTFVPGTTISSAQMNANFAAVEAAVDLLEAQAVMGSARVLADGTMQDIFMRNGNTPTMSHTPGSGVYTITWTGEPVNINTRRAVVSLVGSTPGFVTMSSVGGDLIVRTFNAAGTLTDFQYGIVVFED